MNNSSLFLTVVVVPALMLGATSCASMSETKVKLAEWREKRAAERDEQRMAREVALADKQMAEEAKENGQAVAAREQDSIFLEYANPSGSLLSGAMGSEGVGALAAGGPELPGSELPVVIDFSGSESDSAPGGEPVFHADAEEGGAALDADLVRAWASTISPLMGASLTEPLITAAMTARVSPTDTAIAAHAAATDSAPLASAFAGRPARSVLRTALTSELEHE
jgi:hypothetical protein